MAVSRSRPGRGALLSTDYVSMPYWWADGAGPSSIGEHDVPARADVAVVGGGYTGVAAAHALALRGREVVLFEQNLLGSGASSRNGGSMHPGVKVGVEKLLKRYGRLGRAVFDETVRAFKEGEETIEREQIDCDYVRCGNVELAYRPSHVEPLKAVDRLYREQLDQPTRFVPREVLAEEIGSDVYYGGLVTENSGVLHPAKYFQGVLGAAQRAGAQLCENARVDSLSQRDGGFFVQTSRGSLVARDVLLATDGHTDSLLPAVRRRVIPIGSYMIATEPLAPEVVTSVSPRGRSFSDSKNFLFYWRVLPDGRITFGGRTSFLKTTIEQSRDMLYRSMLSIHPQLEGTRISHAWGGIVGFTLDRTPHMGKIDGVTYALGYCGSGVALSSYFGSQAAQWICGGSPPAFAQLDFPPIPMYRRRPWFLPAVGVYFGMLDRLP